MAQSEFLFRTPVDLPDLPFTLEPAHRILAMGSCFAEHMGSLLHSHGFSCLLNPFGILYNPISLAGSLRRIRDGRAYEEDELVAYRSVWHSWDHHSRYSALDRQEALSKMNASLVEAHAQFQELDLLLLTLGTAKAYFLSEEPERVVGNCHRYPASHFGRRLLGVSEMVEALGRALKILRDARPGLKVLITVSPVRHIRDGLVESQESKAALLLAAHRLVREIPGAYYFPAYEILQDELRDYRFYAADKVHPSEEAMAYIWAKFRQAVFSEGSHELYREMSALNERLQHRPRFPNTEAHLTFLRQTEAMAMALQRKFANLDLGLQLDRLRKEIASHPFSD